MFGLFFAEHLFNKLLHPSLAILVCKVLVKQLHVPVKKTRSGANIYMYMYMFPNATDAQGIQIPVTQEQTV